MDDPLPSSDGSDEEYIPKDNISESSDDSDDADSLDDDPLFSSVKSQKPISPVKDSDRDSIWSDFLNGEHDNKILTKNSATKLNSQENVAIDGSSASLIKEPFISSINSLSAKSRSLSGIPVKRSATSGTGFGDRLGDALKRLKQAALPSTPSKLSTLDKSRLDWEAFTKKEDIVEELKLHNKGKHGYVERKAFETRTIERQYQIEKEARLKGSQRR